jgi:catechol 2,3-dioxygenase-like lactoylglutathione lyase family enzyme
MSRFEQCSLMGMKRTVGVGRHTGVIPEALGAGAVGSRHCQHLGFKEEMHPAPAFAMLSRGDLRLVLSAPNPIGGGGQSMPDGTKPEPGGWNRFSIEVADLATTVEALRKTGVHFRNEIVTGIGGKQILVDDPSGNPIELFEPILPESRLSKSS